jgi:hypothetical protein
MKVLDNTIYFKYLLEFKLTITRPFDSGFQHRFLCCIDYYQCFGFLYNLHPLIKNSRLCQIRKLPIILLLLYSKTNSPCLLSEHVSTCWLLPSLYFCNNNQKIQISSNSNNVLICVGKKTIMIE